MQVNVASSISPSFDGVFYDIQEHKYTHYWLAGGRGSTKSSFIGLTIPFLLMQNPNCHVVVLRKVRNTVKNSVFPQIQWGIDTLQMTGKFRAITSPHEITYTLTGQKILFFGLDDPAKVKSIKLPFGYVGIVWLEELDQFSGMEEIRNVLQSLLRGGEKYWVFCTYNPPKSRNNWVNEEIIQARPDRLVHHSTYLDVPREWLGEQFFLEADTLKNKNELLYRHEYLGEVTGTGGAVFDNVEDMAMSDERVGNFDRLYYGLDFGFAVDPLAFVAIHYDKKKEEVYIFDELYRQKLTNDRTGKWLKRKYPTAMLIADSAEPKSIAELRSMGVNVRGARKGRDSVDYGIKWLQSRRTIYIDKRRCPNAYREFVTYEYERNREGKFISAYPDKNNHAIDAVRYGLDDVMQHDKLVAKHIDY